MRSRLCLIAGGGLLVMAAACAPNQSVISSHQAIAAVNITAGRAFDNYEPVPQDAAAILGCNAAPNLPICLVTVPSSEEDSAFRGEGARLRAHAEPKCRNLGEAIRANGERVKMYPVARRIDDLNDRSLEEKKRTLRHEMSHTIGARESGPTWTAEDYAVRCG